MTSLLPQIVTIQLAYDICSVLSAHTLSHTANIRDKRVIHTKPKKQNGHSIAKNGNGVPTDLGRAALDSSPDLADSSLSDTTNDTHEADTRERTAIASIAKMAVSWNQRWVAFGDTNQALHVYDAEKNQVSR